MGPYQTLLNILLSIQHQAAKSKAVMVPLQPMPICVSYPVDFFVFIKSIADRNSPPILEEYRCGINFASFLCSVSSPLPLNGDDGSS